MERRRSGAILLAVTFTLFGLAAIAGIARLAIHATHDTTNIVGIAVLAGIVTCVVGGLIGWSERPLETTVVRAPSNVEPRLSIDASPYRGAMPPEVVETSIRGSSRATTIVVVACLAFTAAAVPFAVHRAAWIEVEMVLAAWWLVWVVVLSFVARRGATFADDHTFEVTNPVACVRRWLGPSRGTKRDGKATSWTFQFGDLLGGLSDIDGLVLLVVLPVLLPIVFFAAWFVVELVVPLLFFVAYIGVVRALRHAASYRGSRAFVGGVAWATAYVAPLALVVWICHLCFGSHAS